MPDGVRAAGVKKATKCGLDLKSALALPDYFVQTHSRCHRHIE